MRAHWAPVDSKCSMGGRQGDHVWYVHSHDASWRVLGAHCVRCGAECTATSASLAAVAQRRDAYWAAINERKP